MKKSIFSILGLLLIVVLISGCDLDLFMEIDLANFAKEGTDPIEVNGIMNIEVQGCTKSKSNLPEDTVFELQAKIPFIFKGAEYLGCEEKGLFKHMVSFSIPAFLDKERDGKYVDEEIINITYFPNDEGVRTLGLHFPPELRVKMESFFESSAASFIQLSDFKIRFKIIPYERPLSIGYFGVYINDVPTQTNSMEVRSDFTIGIPTYGIEKLIKYDGYFILFITGL